MIKNPLKRGNSPYKKANFHKTDWKEKYILFPKNHLFVPAVTIIFAIASLPGCNPGSTIFKNSDQYQTAIIEANIEEVAYVSENEINALTSLQDRAEVETETVEGIILIKKINGVGVNKSWKLYINGQLIEKAPGTVILKNKDLVEWKFQAQ